MTSGEGREIASLPTLDNVESVPILNEVVLVVDLFVTRHVENHLVHVFLRSIELLIQRA